jgi:chaperonin cofactor prefoldin
MMVKELKRSLASERKRAEKLQERLQEVLHEACGQPVDLQSPPKSQAVAHDTSSVGSWSYVERGKSAGRASSIHSGSFEMSRNDISTPGTPLYEHNGSSHQGHGDTSSHTLLEHENAQLVSRITQLQQEKWSLEEKANQLNLSLQSLTTDAASKAEIIEFYCMEGRSDPTGHHGHASPLHGDKLTVKRVVDFIKDRGDENLKEINRKLQRMLEETLTKNMHLHKDLERLSTQVDRLSTQVDRLSTQVDRLSKEKQLVNGAND